MKKPVNEMGVVSLFAQYSQGLGYVIMEIQAAFPDATLYEISTKRMIKVEFEYKAKNFKSHKHDITGCDLIICWENNWKDCPLKVLELNKIHGEEPVETVYLLQRKSEILKSDIRTAMDVSSDLESKIKRSNFEAKVADGKRKLMTRDMIKTAIDESINNKQTIGNKEYKHVGYFRCRKCGDAISKIFLDDFDGKTFALSEDGKSMIFVGFMICGCGGKRKFKTIDYAGCFIDE